MYEGNFGVTALRWTNVELISYFTNSSYRGSDRCVVRVMPHLECCTTSSQWINALYTTPAFRRCATSQRRTTHAPQSVSTMHRNSTVEQCSSSHRSSDRAAHHLPADFSLVRRFVETSRTTMHQDKGEVSLVCCIALRSRNGTTHCMPHNARGFAPIRGAFQLSRGFTIRRRSGALTMQRITFSPASSRPSVR